MKISLDPFIPAQVIILNRVLTFSMESAVIRDSRSAVARGLISGPSQTEIKGIKLQYSIHVPTKHLRRELTFIFPGHLSQHEDMKVRETDPDINVVGVSACISHPLTSLFPL